MLSQSFKYQEAFSRNIGLITEEEQERLRSASAAIPGMGGMGGAHALTLARLGIGQLTMADFDQYEVVNFNRQVGATVNTVGKRKLDVMVKRVKEINPEIELRTFDEAITSQNAGAFLEDADILLDGLDFFSFENRRHLFNTARKKGLHVVSSGPIGFSAILQIFSPHGMSFDRYFAIQDGMTKEEKLLSFLVGIAPGGTHLSYINSDKVSLGDEAGPSLGLAVQMAAGLAAAQVGKILLDRGPVPCVPYYFQVDAYTMQCKKGRLWWGNRNPIQRLKLWYVKRLLQAQRES
ncbi:MAG: ThiF family adenylyltransferase [Anaerolineales bacterium]